jgi:hypothetical protein
MAYYVGGMYKCMSEYSFDNIHRMDYIKYFMITPTKIFDFKTELDEKTERHKIIEIMNNTYDITYKIDDYIDVTQMENKNFITLIIPWEDYIDMFKPAMIGYKYLDMIDNETSILSNEITNNTLYKFGDYLYRYDNNLFERLSNESVLYRRYSMRMI